MRYMELMEASKPRWRKAKVGDISELFAGRRWYGRVIKLADGTYEYRGWKTSGKAATEAEAKAAIEAVAAAHPVHEVVIPFPGNPRSTDKAARVTGGTVLDMEAYRNQQGPVTTHGHGGHWTARVNGQLLRTAGGRARRFKSHTAARGAGLLAAFHGSGRSAQPLD
jgi:hypothetical protein